MNKLSIYRQGDFIMEAWPSENISDRLFIHQGPGRDTKRLTVGEVLCLRDYLNEWLKPYGGNSAKDSINLNLEVIEALADELLT